MFLLTTTGHLEVNSVILGVTGKTELSTGSQNISTIK